MGPTRRWRVLAGLVLAVGVPVSACSDGTSGAVASGLSAPVTSNGLGGTLTLLGQEQVTAWDPQRIASRHDAAVAGRLFVRTLTAYAPVGENGRSHLVGDLATDTGKASADLKTWTFTLRDKVTWEDGSDVTCADVAYGLSRSFATDVIRGGARDAVTLLAIPRREDGTSTYAGPWASGDQAQAGQAAYDQAVTCDGRTVTFHLATPTSDWAAILSQPALAPLKKEKDPKDTPFAVFSDGPYLLKDRWDPVTGGVFVRNPRWNADSDPVRKARPDTIAYHLGVDSATAAHEVLADTGRGHTSVVMTALPVPLRLQVLTIPNVRSRSITPGTGLVEHLVPNLKSTSMGQLPVRRALAMATDRNAYVTALGGLAAAGPTRSVLPAQLTAAHDTDPLDVPLGGDPAKARTELEATGLALPVPLRVAYRQGPSADKAMAALSRGWDAAGFATELVPLGEDYFTQASAPEAASQYDVMWSSWAPTWDSGATVLPALFDPTVNLTATGTGRDLGSYDAPEVTRAMVDAAGLADANAREKAWRAIDIELQRDVAYIGLAERRAMFVAGTGVGNLAAHPFAGGDPDLAVLGVLP